MAWLSPTGHNDPSGEWFNEANAYDEATESGAYDLSVPANSWSEYLELTHASFVCAGCRFWVTNAAGSDPLQASVDIYYDSAWHNVFEGNVSKGTWVEKTWATQTITAARIKIKNTYSGSSHCYLWEFDFDEASVTEKSSSDTGSGADAYLSLETGEAKLSSDIGSGLESAPLPGASLAGSETGAGIETLAARLLASLDTGTGVEVAQLVGLLKSLFATELGEGCDLLIAKIEMPTKGGGMKLWT